MPELHTHRGAGNALDGIRQAIIDDPANAWAGDLGWTPLYVARPGARIAIVGQAPGRRAQESGVPWNDPSGVRLRSWLGISDAEFYAPELVALLGMDFYFPGKGTTGDLPPRKDFAPRWHPPILSNLHDLQLTVLIGSYAQKHYLADRRKPTLTDTVRAYQDYLPSFIPLVHPSPLNVRWHRRNPWFELDVLPELRRRVRAALEVS